MHLSTTVACADLPPMLMVMPFPQNELPLEAEPMRR